ncbi:MAG: hypothetical protein ACE5Z5_08360 [Candidatus Bathyarchaeia archaeon]
MSLEEISGRVDVTYLMPHRVRGRRILFFTSDRVIVAKRTHKTVGEWRRGHPRECKLSIEEILKGDEGNFAIPNSDIEKVDMAQPITMYGDLDRWEDAAITIFTAAKQHKFIIENRGEFRRFINIVESTLFDKVSVGWSRPG